MMEDKGENMKKSRNIILCIVLLVIIAIIVIFSIISQKKNKVIKNETYDEAYYTVTYSTNTDGADVLNNKQGYEVVEEKKRLNEILKKAQAQSYDIFDDAFFTNHNVLIVEASINPEFNKCEITDTKADIVIYAASPLTSTEDIWDFNLYLIPVNKNIEDIQVEVTTYPDRVY